MPPKNSTVLLRLQESEGRLLAILSSFHDLVLAFDRSGTITDYHVPKEHPERFPSPREAYGRALEDVFPDSVAPELRRVVDAIVRTGDTRDMRFGMRIGDDERSYEARLSPLRGDGEVVGVSGVVLDVTEKLRMQDELTKTQRLESLGVLAGGIAHDFNNILTAILGNLGLAQSEADQDGRVGQMLLEAERACVRARDLTHQLLTFSKGGAPVTASSSIEEIVRESAGFCLHGSNVRCVFEFEDELRPVEVDRGQVGQVIDNLVINADQAMPEGGFLWISARNVEDADGRALVRITFRDEGAGIDPDLVTRIFDPFFTTKTEGSGLGLATAHSIVQKHRGTLAAHSHLGAGAELALSLPAAARPPIVDAESTPVRPANGGRVLVMDDERPVLDTVRRMLTRLGYEAECAEDGEHAIELWLDARARGRDFDLVIVDLTVPGGMGGQELMRHLLEIDATTRVVVSSGYSNSPVLSEHERHGFRDVVLKPYRFEELGRKLRSVLAG